MIGCWGLVAGSCGSKLVLDGWWLVVMVGNWGVKQKMSGTAGVAILLLHWQIMI